MAGLHRVALIALTLGLTASADGQREPLPEARALGAMVTLTGGDEPGSVTIVNRGASVQWVARALSVEYRDGASWQPVGTNMDVIAACDPRFPRRVAPVRLLPGQSVSVMPWTGFSCGGQCPASCRMRIYRGRGPFRIVATLVPGNAHVTGPVFMMPAEPKPEVNHPVTREDILAAFKAPRAGENDP